MLKNQKQNILVIGPGAGTRQYKNIWDNIIISHNIFIVHGFIKNINYDSYPKNWTTNNPDMSTNNNYNLASLSNIVLDKYLHLQNKSINIDLIICGSRGGQVTLPALWRLFDSLNIKSPPCIIFNSGILHSPIKWPENIPIILLSFGNDNFNTKDYKLVLKSAKNNKSFGYVVYMPNESHGPILFLYKYILNIIKYMPQTREELCSQKDKFIETLNNSQEIFIYEY